MTIEQTMWKDSTELAKNVNQLREEIDRLAYHKQWRELQALLPCLESHADNIRYAAKVVQKMVENVKEGRR